MEWVACPHEVCLQEVTRPHGGGGTSHSGGSLDGNPICVTIPAQGLSPATLLPLATPSVWLLGSRVRVGGWGLK